MSRHRLAIAVATLGLLAMPGAAHAATASISGSQIVVSAGGNEPNNLIISDAAPNVRIQDTGFGVTLAPGAGCVSGGPDIVLCPSAGIASLTVTAGDRDDDVTTSSALAATIDGGVGDDDLIGGGAADTLTGGADSDEIIGGGGVDTLNGGADDDAMDGGLGADLLNGGTGSGDWVTYQFRTAAVTADLDGAADDGEAGENDTIATDVERLMGGSANDTLTGDGGDNLLDGGLGTDVLNGGAGTDFTLYWTRTSPVAVTFDGVANDGEPGENDVLGSDLEGVIGGSGNDTLTGDSGANSLLGLSGNDTIDGAGGDDFIFGEDGNDTERGGAEDDTIIGWSGTDTMEGGAGEDLVTYNAYWAVGITASIDGVANDGPAGENDNIATDVENLDGGQNNDTLTGSGDANVLGGLGGNDTLNGAGGNDSLGGGSGADTLNGDAGTDLASYASRTAPVSADNDGVADDGAAGENDNVGGDVEDLLGGSAGDTLTGNGGDNTLNGGPGGDVMNGGNGSDTVTYASRTAAVRADLDGIGDDGEVGENDNVGGDVEKLIGGAAGDTLTGNEGDNIFDGGPSGDVMTGGGGNDAVTYASRTGAVTADLDGVADDGEQGESDSVGDDVEALVGGAAADTLTGSAGPNRLEGGAGDDVLDGADGADQFDAGPGSDTLRARDGVVDSARCGSEQDSLLADADDDAASDCESVELAEAAMAVAITAKKLRISERGVALLPVKCELPEGICEGTVKLTVKRLKQTKKRPAHTSRRSRPRRAVIGRASFKAPAGETVKVKVKLSRNGRRRVLRERKLRCRATVKTVAEDGTQRVVEKALTLVAPAKTEKGK